MNKQILEYPYHGMHFSNKKEETTDLHIMLHLNSKALSRGSQKQNITHSRIPFIWNSMKGKEYSEEKLQGLPGFSGWEEGIDCKVRTCWDEGHISYHDCNSYTIADRFDETHEIRYFTRVDFEIKKNVLRMYFYILRIYLLWVNLLPNTYLFLFLTKGQSWSQKLLWYKIR